MRHFFTGINFLFAFIAFSQQQAPVVNQTDNHHIALKPKDSTCLKDCFLKAHWEAHARTFFMSTTNEAMLKDDYAMAAGAGIGLVTQPIYGFQLGLSGYFIYNVFSSHLEKPDPTTNGTNRYEIGLFDIENPTNKNDLDRLEELYIKYSYSKSAVTIGKININTPFVNPQDGRMRPTLEEGVWLNIHESHKFGFNGGWIWEISPRSTIKWFPLANSVGVYPGGVTSKGTKSDYSGNIVGSKGLAIANVYFKPKEHVKINVWNGLFENVMNTGIIEINTETQKTNFKLYQGLLFVHQDALNNGGNADQNLSYIDKGAQSNAISAQVGIKNKKINLSLNYTHITSDGRYLMPREWGKEVFYTFMPRERNEGYGGVHAIMAKSAFQFYQNKFKTGIVAGYYKLPDVKDFRLNKYGMPSYFHINYDASYTFDKFLKGMEIKVLVAYKLNAGETYDNLKYVYNKVNLLNLNFILDFKI